MPLPLATALAAGPVVLDGGLSTELESRGHDVTSALWSARLLRDDPGAIREAHAAFEAAGAQVATTASYQATVPGFTAAGFADAAGLIRRSVQLAREGAPSSWVAGSVGPYGAYLADGSEYTGDYLDEVSTGQLREFHRPRLAALAEAGVDVLACETLPGAGRGGGVAGRGDRARRPRVVLVVRGHRRRRRGPDPPRRAAVRRAGHGARASTRWSPWASTARTRRPSSRRWCGRGSPAASRSWSTPTAARPGTPTRGPGRAPPGSATSPRWLAAGARLVGGCCRVRPADVGAIAATVHGGSWSA